MKAFKIYPFALAAGGSQALLCEGSYVRVKTASGDVQLSFDDIGPFGPLSSGQGKKGTPFKRILITDVSGNVNNGTLIVADSDFVDDRITGEVSVIDGGKSRTLANQAFIGTVGQGGANLAQCQLWQPGATTRIILKSYTVSVGGACGVNVGFYNVALATAAGSVFSKLSGGAAGVGLLKKSTSAAAQMVNVIETLNFPGAGTITRVLTEPVILQTAFTGFMVENGNAAVSQNVTFETVEEAAT